MVYTSLNFRYLSEYVNVYVTSKYFEKLRLEFHFHFVTEFFECKEVQNNIFEELLNFENLTRLTGPSGNRKAPLISGRIKSEFVVRCTF